MKHTRWLLALGLLALPKYVWAVALLNAVPGFGGIGVVGSGIIGAAYLFGGVGVAWSGVHTVSAYRNRDMEGMSSVWTWVGVTMIGAILIVTIIPALIGPLVAQGATL
jgi:hypothetical protein